MRSQIRYQERTGYAWWVHALMGFVVLACVTPSLAGVGALPWSAGTGWSAGVHLPPLVIGLAVALVFYGLFGELRTRVTDGEIKLAFGFVELIRKTVPFSEIRAVKAVTYSPIREFGGWGIRWGTKGRSVWSTRGDRALQLELTNGKVFLIGSDRPERIVPWIRLGEKKEEEA